MLVGEPSCHLEAHVIRVVDPDQQALGGARNN
jgi:hypothetical protein